MNKHQMQYGLHVIKVLLNKAPERVMALYIDQNRKDQRLDEILELAKAVNIVAQKTTAKTLDKLVEGAPHQGLVAQCRPIKTVSVLDLLALIENKTGSLLVLDGIQDPHNVGACLRSAEALGVDGVILVKDRASPITSTVSKVSSGADQIIPIATVTNLAQTLKLLQKNGLWVIGLAGEADLSLMQCDLKRSVALVLGGEAKGLRHLTREICDQLVYIPMLGVTESLNVSVAAGIAIYEIRRQHTQN